MKKRVRITIILGLIICMLCGCNNTKPDVIIGTTPSAENTSAETTESTTETTTQEPETSVSETDVPSSEAVSTEEVSTQEVTETTPEESASEEITTEAPTTQEATTSQPAEPETATQAPTVSEEPKAWDLLNNEPLNPTTSGYTELDNLINNFITNEVALTDDMSPYQKVWTCYEWFIKNIVYNRGMDANAGQYSSSDPATTPVEVLWATDLLNTYQGCCYNYSAAFMYIMRALGYDAHLVSGQVSSYNGGTTPHCWLYVNLGGVAYTFDPDVDMNYYWRYLKEGKEVMSTLFCRRMDTMNYFYTIEKYHDI